MPEGESTDSVRKIVQNMFHLEYRSEYASEDRLIEL